MASLEWGPAKARSSLAKHGVDFEVAKDVFLDQADLWISTRAIPERSDGALSGVPATSSSS
jgi:uncharacterized DUF497 family protein